MTVRRSGDAVHAVCGAARVEGGRRLGGRLSVATSASPRRRRSRRTVNHAVPVPPVPSSTVGSPSAEGQHGRGRRRPRRRAGRPESASGAAAETGHACRRRRTSPATACSVTGSVQRGAGVDRRRWCTPRSTPSPRSRSRRRRRPPATRSRPCRAGRASRCTPCAGRSPVFVTRSGTVLGAPSATVAASGPPTSQRGGPLHGERHGDGLDGSRPLGASWTDQRARGRRRPGCRGQRERRAGRRSERRPRRVGRSAVAAACRSTGRARGRGAPVTPAGRMHGHRRRRRRRARVPPTLADREVQLAGPSVDQRERGGRGAQRRAGPATRRSRPGSAARRSSMPAPVTRSPISPSDRSNDSSMETRSISVDVDRAAGGRGCTGRRSGPVPVDAHPARGRRSRANRPAASPANAAAATPSSATPSGSVTCATRSVAAVPPLLRTPTASSWPPRPASRASPPVGQLDRDVGGGRPGARSAPTWAPSGPAGLLDRGSVGRRPFAVAVRGRRRRRLVGQDPVRQQVRVGSRRRHVGRLRRRDARHRREAVGSGARRARGLPLGRVGPAAAVAAVAGPDRRLTMPTAATAASATPPTTAAAAPSGIAARNAATPPAAAAPPAGRPDRADRPGRRRRRHRPPAPPTAAAAATAAPPAAAPPAPPATGPPAPPHRAPRRLAAAPAARPPPTGSSDAEGAECRRRPSTSGAMTARMPWLTSPSSSSEAATRAAVLEVRLDLRGLPRAQPAADVGAELAGDRTAALVERVLQVLLEVRLPQSLARAVGEGGDAVRGQPEDRRDLRGGQPLDLGVPQHGLPALGQRVERTRDDPALEAGERGLLGGARPWRCRARGPRRRRSARHAGPCPAGPPPRDARR